MARKLFCDINPTCYKLSLKKENLLRNIKDAVSFDRIAKEKSKTKLPIIVKGHFSLITRKLHGVDQSLQESKMENIRLACKKINNLIINPNEVFSFWKTIGEPIKENGFKEGLVISRKGFGKGYGGGLCQMANMIHYLVLHSPLKVTELHHHADSLFPDYKRKVPFGTGTSVCYKNIDYRFKNTSDQRVSINVWIEGEYLYGELRSTNEFPYRYKLIEEDAHFHKEKEQYFRISKVYRLIIDKKTNKEVKKELLLNNHSGVMYDYNLIPKDEIK